MPTYRRINLASDLAKQEFVSVSKHLHTVLCFSVLQKLFSAFYWRKNSKTRNSYIGLSGHVLRATLCGQNKAGSFRNFHVLIVIWNFASELICIICVILCFTFVVINTL